MGAQNGWKDHYNNKFENDWLCVFSWQFLGVAIIK